MTRTILDPSRRSRPSLVALAGALVLLLTACGGGGEEPAANLDAGAAAHGVPAAAAGDPDVLPLPVLPSAAERSPERFDRSGCALGPDGRDCEAGAAAIDVTQAGDDTGWRHLRGFSGLDWTTRASGTVALLEPSIHSPETGHWRATGLVRNGLRFAVDAPVVTATLLDTDGALLDTVASPTLLEVLRPGEPAPFHLTSEIAAEQVAIVRWAVEPASGDGSPGDESPGDEVTTLGADGFVAASTEPGRDLELSVLWQRHPDDPRPADLYLYRDPPQGPRPLVVFGQAIAVGPAPVPGTRVTGAWIDDTGAVLAVAEALVAHPVDIDLDAPGDPATRTWLPPDLAPGDVADIVLVLEPDDVGPALADAQLVLWGTGS